MHMRIHTHTHLHTCDGHEAQYNSVLLYLEYTMALNVYHHLSTVLSRKIGVTLFDFMIKNFPILYDILVV